jgi:hypothetical protein
MTTSRNWVTVGDPLGEVGQGVVFLVEDASVTSPQEVIVDSVRRLCGTMEQEKRPAMLQRFSTALKTFVDSGVRRISRSFSRNRVQPRGGPLPSSFLPIWPKMRAPFSSREIYPRIQLQRWSNPGRSIPTSVDAQAVLRPLESMHRLFDVLGVAPDKIGKTCIGRAIRPSAPRIWAMTSIS